MCVQHIRDKMNFPMSPDINETMFLNNSDCFYNKTFIVQETVRYNDFDFGTLTVLIILLINLNIAYEVKY